MDIKSFAETYRVRVKQDSCGDSIIPGRERLNRVEDRSHIFDYENGEHFGVSAMFGSAKKWGNARRKMEAAGFLVRQNGDTEGIALFNPRDKTQARLALKVAGVKARRTLSPERKEALAKVLAQARAVRQAQLGTQ